MTTLMEEMRLALQELLQSIGLGEAGSTAATVVPLLMLGIVLNVVALSVVDRVHPIKAKARVAHVVRAEARLVQGATVCVLRQIEGREGGLCPVKRWASTRSTEWTKCRLARCSSHLTGRYRGGFALPGGDRSHPMVAGRALRAT
jgi:hypothetical protein